MLQDLLVKRRGICFVGCESGVVGGNRMVVGFNVLPMMHFGVRAGQRGDGRRTRRDFTCIRE